MAATGVRLIMKFNFGQQIRFCGWSESVDLGYADLPTAIAASTNIAAFLTARANCLGVGPILVEAVLSAYVQPLHAGDPPLRRNTLSFPVPEAPKDGLAYNAAFNAQSKLGVVDYVADFANTVYYIRLQTNLSGTPVYSRNLWIAGLPDVADQTSSPRITEPTTNTAVTAYMNALCNGNISTGIPSNASKNSVSVFSVDHSGANPIKSCTSWNLNANTYTVPAHGFQANQPIIAEGMKTVPGGSCPRGEYLVGPAIDANTISLVGAGTPTAPKKLGGFRAAVKVFNVVQIATGEGFTKRDKGRPSGLAVGRARRQLIKRA